MHAHKHTRVHLHTSAAPDLSGPAKPIEGLWRFICHSNVFLGKMPAQGEPRYSGRDTVVFSVSDKSCVSVSLSYSTSLRACVVCVCRGGAISQIYGNWNGRIFWGKCSQFDSAAKKGHPIQFALNGIRGATGKHLKANDLIKASQASPLTHCIKAICWLLNKRIIFYLDFCARGRLVALGSG